MVPVNPMYYLQHAWDNTNSAWGKAAIVLFYSFVWIQILWAVQILIVPLAGFGCFVNEGTDTEVLLMSGMLRELNVFTIGFFLYSDRGGIKVWNVGMVFAVYLVFVIVWLSSFGSSFVEHYPSCKDVNTGWNNVAWVTLVWATLAFVAAFMDDGMGQGSGAGGESAPLLS
uniref:Uncharacterized protein n=1 Tax=Amphora coffeiformis TaxID=265554 RepID=A0A7S3LA60_9STRA|mmetsp:Transcript_14868/g.28363  ORF Transcript_14868/g.28363 Transcript_14868/m.28363 type:complete len:170 (-) Transcript_14868:31-540(-)|eukprot:scaffold2335_cov175-Amphora_coffeaeformis.AAC.5